MGWLRRLLGREEPEPPEPEPTPVPTVRVDMAGAELRMSLDLTPPPPVPRPPPAPPASPSPPPLPAPSLPQPTPEQTYVSHECPYCGTVPAKLPKAKSACRTCGEPIYVRTGVDGERYLLRHDQVEPFEAQRDAARHSERQRASFVSGPWRLDVVGESHYQPAIADARETYGWEAMATLVPEARSWDGQPGVRVEIAGKTVGHVGREDMANIGLLIERLTREHGRPSALAIITGGPPRQYYGVVLEGLAEE